MKKKRTTPPRFSKPITVEKDSIVAKKQYHLATNLLGDKQLDLIYACTAIRMHRDRKWKGEPVDCEFDRVLYQVLDEIVQQELEKRHKGANVKRQSSTGT